MLGITLVLGLGLFFFAPLLIARFVAGDQPGIVERVVEGVVQVAIFLGYLILIGRTPDVRRTFQYHGAEHMTIHALEAGDPLTVDEVRKYPTAHPRCGTEFLVVVILVSIIAFSLVGRQSLPVMIVSRLILIPVIAAVSYELLRFGARHRSNALVRVFFEPGIWVQKITTKQPTDDMIEVAIVSMEQALDADGEELPAGSGTSERPPLLLAGAPPALAPGPDRGLARPEAPGARRAARGDQAELSRPETMTDPDALRRLGRDLARLEPVVGAYRRLEAIRAELAGAREMQIRQRRGSPGARRGGD